MSLGDSNFTLRSGGGTQRASAANLAKAIVGIGFSPLAPPNTLVQVGDPSLIPSLLDSGECAEWATLTARGGQTRYLMAVNPSTAGGLSAAVNHNGPGTGSIVPSLAPHKPILVKCIVGGPLGTASYQFSLDGGTTFSPTFLSTVTSFAMRVPGTYCTLTFGAATYVATKTLTVGIDGTVTPGSGWVGTVTQVSSPIDPSCEVVCNVVTGGALGAAVLSVSLDNGRSTLPNLLIPSSGLVVLSGTGIVLTCTNIFVAGESYSFLAVSVGGSTTDFNNALTALKAIQGVQFTQIHLLSLPSSAAGAFSLAATLEAALEDGFNNFQLDWDGMVECPSASAGLGLGDIVLSGSNAIRDTADTDAVVKAARGADMNRTAVHVGTYPIASTATGRKYLRPLGWACADRLVDTDPRDDLSATQPFGALRIFIPPGSTSIGRDEYKTPSLDDVQINTARTYRGRGINVFLSITKGGSGWKNCTTDAAYQDKGFMRIVNSSVATMRPVMQDLMGQRPETNPDGTIQETPARAFDLKIDGAFKRATGLQVGGDFKLAQASFAGAKILRSSQLGQSPKRLDASYTIQSLGFISDESSVLTFSGVLSAQ